jgi:hypothetical protein
VGIIALVGDCTTTTAIALAAGWPRDDDAVVVELDRSGGSLSAWLDTPATPSLSTLVATRPSRHSGDNLTPSESPGGTLTSSDLESIVQRSATGIRFVAAPIMAREADRAIEQIERPLVGLLADDARVALADLGRHWPPSPVPRAVRASLVTVVVHRQEVSSAAAASVRIERLVETVELLGATGADLFVAVVGDRPFEAHEIAAHLLSATSASILGSGSLPVDPLAAMVLAGRAGVSARRLARLPLARAAARLADQFDAANASRQVAGTASS